MWSYQHGTISPQILRSPHRWMSISWLFTCIYLSEESSRQVQYNTIHSQSCALVSMRTTISIKQLPSKVAINRDMSHGGSWLKDCDVIAAVKAWQFYGLCVLEANLYLTGLTVLVLCEDYKGFHEYFIFYVNFSEKENIIFFLHTVQILNSVFNRTNLPSKGD